MDFQQPVISETFSVTDGVKVIRTYHNGILNGYGKDVDELNELVADGYYLNGQMEGEIIFVKGIYSNADN